MNVKNPLDTELYIKIDGVEYTIPANGEKSGIPVDHAERWKRVHAFIILAPDAPVAPVTPAAPVEPIVLEVPEVPATVATTPTPTPDAAPLKSEVHKEVEVKAAPKKK